MRGAAADDGMVLDGSQPPLPGVPLEPEPHRAPSSAPKLIYLTLLLLPVGLGAAIVLIRTGVIATRAETARTPWDLSVIFLSIVTTLVMAFYVWRRLPTLLERARGATSDQSLSSWEFGTLMATSPLAVLLGVVSFLSWAGLVPFPFPSDPMAPILVGAFGILVACAPTAAFAFVRQRTVRAMEERFPDFLRDLNESYGAGMTMAQAIRVAARGDYGRLNGEIRQMARLVSWGTPFPDALRIFSDRVGTPLVVRAVSLINKATEAGGNVKDVLAAAARDARELEGLESDRRSGMALYVIVIYVAYAVFLSVVAALQGLLVPSLLASTLGTSGAAPGVLAISQRLTHDDFRFIYFGVGLVQALGSGIVAGVMSEGSVSAGLKHSAILVAVTIATLGVLL